MMTIKKINIKQFGRFSKAEFVFPNHPFLIVYGPNEMGKSTLKTFITHILFGFPAKHHLEPFMRINGGEQLGGSVTLGTAEIKNMTLERQLSQRNAPRVLLENGEARAYSHIEELFTGMNHALYEAIFCFDLDGLHGIEKIGADELNHLLLNAGMMGSARLSQLEQNLDKKISELFKPSGRKPRINQAISDLDHKQAELKAWEKKLDRYTELQEFIKGNEEELLSCQHEKRALEEKRRRYIQFLSLKPLMISYRTLNHDIEQMPSYQSFPENALDRFEKWQTQVIALEGEAAELARMVEQTEQSIGAIPLDQQWLSKERSIVSLIKKTPEYEHVVQELQVIQERKQHEQRKLNSSLHKLGSGWTIDAVEQTVTGIEMKDHLKRLLSERQKAINEKDQLEQGVNQSLARSQGIKEKLASVQNQLLNSDKRRQIERDMAQTNDFIGLEREKVLLKQQCDGMQERRKLVDKTKKVSLAVGAAGAVFSIIIGLLIYQMVNPFSGSVIGGIGVFLSLALAGIIFTFSGRMSQVGTETHALERLKEIDQLMMHPKGDYQGSKAILDKNNQDLITIGLQSDQLDEEKRAYEKVITALDRAELNEETVQQRLDEWLHEHRFPDTNRYDVLEDITQLIEEAKTAIEQMNQYDEQMGEREQRKKSYERTKKDIMEIINIQGDDIWLLERELAEQKDHAQEISQLSKQRTGLLEQKGALDKKIERYQNECLRLIELAGADDAENFRQRAEQYEVRQRLEVKQAELKQQMQQVAVSERAFKQAIEWLDTGKWDHVTEEALQQEWEELDERGNALSQQSVQWQSELRNLVRNQTYANLLYEFEADRTLLNEQARQWAVYKTAQTLLDKTKENYRRQKLPKVLEQASEYFSRITNGVYRTIYLVEGSSFMVEHLNGTTFYVNELSRGTAEQLYLALRLALASVFESHDAFPIVIDDSLVNTDSARHKRVLEVLNEVSKKHQVILFTCHKERYQHHPSEAWLELC